MNKKLKTIVILLLLTLGVSSVFASAEGKGHTHTASKTKIEKNAKRALSKFINSKKIDKTWSKAKLLSMKKIDSQWIVKFKNIQTKEQSKQVLNFYLTTYGKVKGANYQNN